MKIPSSITGSNNKFDASKLRIQAWNGEKTEARRFTKFETCLLIRLSAFLSLVPLGGMSVIAIFLIRYNDVTYNADANIYYILPIDLRLSNLRSISLNLMICIYSSKQK